MILHDVRFESLLQLLLKLNRLLIFKLKIMKVTFDITKIFTLFIPIE